MYKIKVTCSGTEMEDRTNMCKQMMPRGGMKQAEQTNNKCTAELITDDYQTACEKADGVADGQREQQTTV